AKAGNEANVSINGEHLAVVPGDPSERSGETRRIVAAHFDAAFAEPRPVTARSLPHATHPVVDEPHTDASSRGGNQRLREDCSGRILVDDVALEMDVLARCTDGIKPRGVVFGGILQQPDPVAFDHWHSGGPREELVG